MRDVADAIFDLADGLQRLLPERRLGARRFMPERVLDTLNAAATVYRTAAELDERLQVAAATGDPDIESLRALASDLNREAWTAFKYQIAAMNTERTHVVKADLGWTVGLRPVNDIRRGLEVRPDLVDLDALAARGARLRNEVDTRLFAVSRLLQTVNDMAFGDNVISQFSRRLNTALASVSQPTAAPASSPAELHRLVVGVDKVRTLVTNVAGADLRDADLHDVSLVGVFWSTTTLWPPSLRDRIAAESVPAGDGLFQITDHGPFRSTPAVPQ